MQKSTVNILTLIICLFLSPNINYAQVSSYRLQQADSMFAAKRYTLALQQYEGVIKNNEYSPALLLKMAYLHEALGHVAETQYFLNLYSLSTNDDSVFEKMESLASKHNLQGYELSNTQKVMSVYRGFQTQITLVIVALLIICLAVVIYQRRVAGKRPIAAFVCQLIVCAALVVHLYASTKSTAYIVTRSNIYLMSGPSVGADVVEILDEGHRFDVIGKKDVWFKVKWNGQDAFLKEDAVKQVAL